ncbi:MAG TPA: hypothetical protein PKI34_09240 [Bacteroidales bacterium]|nr:hypothetical protein [Bacteroidales bacterium]
MNAYLIRRSSNLVLLAFILMTGKMQAQTTFMIHEFNLIYRGEFKPRLSLKADHWFTDRLAFNSYFYATPNWSEGDVGIGYQVANWAYVGCMVGIQNEGDHLMRIMPNFYLVKGNFSLLGLFGHGIGTDTDRFALQFFYNFGSFKVGAEGIKEFTIRALGPRFDYTLVDAPSIHLWAAPYYDFTYDKYAAMFGLYAIFGSISPKETLFD